MLDETAFATRAFAGRADGSKVLTVARDQQFVDLVALADSGLVHDHTRDFGGRSQRQHDLQRLGLGRKPEEVVEPIEGGSGRVKVGDSVWSATGPDAETGTRMKIVGAEGNRLAVEPLPALVSDGDSVG